jgi:tRNA(fMet)-specific endonuclease VapC
MLDTNICIYIIKRNPESVLRHLEIKRDGLAISTIVLAELEHGVAASAYPERNALALVRFLIIARCLPFTDRAAGEYGRIRADLQRRGKIIGELDMLIAAHAKSEGLVFVTNNMREFERVEGLRLENWID